MATCTAPGHPECSITCSGECYAAFVEPDGPCVVGCSSKVFHSVTVDPDQTVSMHIQDMSLGSVVELFRGLLKCEIAGHEGREKQKINIRRASVKIATLLSELDLKVRPAEAELEA